MRRCLGIGMAAALLACGAATAEESVVHARLVLAAANASGKANADVELRAASGVQQVVASIPGEVDVAVPRGVVYVRLKSNAFWSGTRAFDVRTDGDVLRVDVVPAGVVTGRVTLAGGKREIPSAAMLFRDSKDQTTTVPCDVAALQWSCVVPAGVRDMRLRIPGYVSAYFWRTAVPAAGRVNTGETTLRRGASVVGTVVIGEAERNRPTVTLQPLRLAPAGEGGALTMTTAHADARGFFHFDGVAPGMYTAVATLSGYASTTTTVRVVEGRESELLAPLRLERPRAVELLIRPATDPAGQPWHVSLLSKREGIYNIVTQNGAFEDGRWSWRGAPGAYLVDVSASDRSLWAEQEITVAGESTTIPVAIEPRVVHGIVRLGGKPLRATVAFGSRNGPRLESADDGTFSGSVPVPADRQWRVWVASEASGIQRDTVAHEDDEGTLRIDLPAGRIAGIVSDEQGTGVANAIVTIAGQPPRDGFHAQVHSGPGGVFEASGLDTGTYALSAEAPSGQSDPADVPLNDGEDRRIELVIHPHRVIHGSVSSSFGPVSGAEIYVVPLQGSVTNRFWHTDASGEFNAVVPPETQMFDIAVAAPGFARMFFRTSYQATGTLQLRVNQNSGTLTLDIPRSLLVPAPNWTYLVRGEARIMLGLAQRWGVEQKSRESERAVIELPQMEAGPYALCVTPAAGVPNAGPLDPNHCVSGVLAPYGRLALRLEKP